MRITTDFHYSDVWIDSVHQTRHVAWAISNRKCLGVFYREPEAYNWKSYGKGTLTPAACPQWHLMCSVNDSWKGRS
ncbi:MAG: glycosyl hydrolase 53 family protein [Bacteroidales bacterium]|nr:glycosyl hydrolase 53 family protein [Bacteroidales bacterium]